MGTRKSSYLYFGSSTQKNNQDSQFEFDESEVWSSSSSSDTSHHHVKKPTLLFPLKKPSKKNQMVPPVVAAGTSLPVKIPDWSRILGDDEYKGHRKEDGAGGDEEEDRLPPHEYLARTRGSSLSVHEGIGRTLKGRDMSRVRNAVWKRIGFED